MRKSPKPEPKLVGFKRRYQLARIPITSAPDITGQLEIACDELNRLSRNMLIEGNRAAPDACVIDICQLDKTLCALIEWWQPLYDDTE